MPTDTQSQSETGKKQDNNKKQWKENAAKKM